MAYVAVTWTTGDTITEAKMDNMTANDAGFNDGSAVGSAAISTYNMVSNEAEGVLQNGRISVTDTGSGINVAIKTLAGADATSTTPIKCVIGGTERSITAALSVTAADGTDFFAAGSGGMQTNEIDYFVYLGYNATDGVVVGFARIPYARQYSDFSATSTNAKYAKISTITTAASTDYYNVIGRFAATLSAGAGFTWSVPTYTAINLIQRPIFKTRTLAYTPTLTSGTGTITSSSVTGTYRIEETIMDLWNVITITTNGTGATDLRVTQPIAWANANFSGYGARTDAAMGLTINGALGVSSIDIRTAAADLYPGADGKVYATHVRHIIA